MISQWVDVQSFDSLINSFFNFVCSWKVPPRRLTLQRSINKGGGADLSVSLSVVVRIAVRSAVHHFQYATLRYATHTFHLCLCNEMPYFTDIRSKFLFFFGPLFQGFIQVFEQFWNKFLIHGYSFWKIYLFWISFFLSLIFFWTFCWKLVFF